MAFVRLDSRKKTIHAIEAFFEDFSKGFIPEVPALGDSAEFAWMEPLLSGIIERRHINYAKRDTEREDWLRQTQGLLEQLVKAKEISSHLLNSARDTISLAHFAASKSMEISQRTQSLASGIENLDFGMNKVADRTNQSSQIVNHARSLTQNAATYIQSLDNSRDEIGQIIKVIESVASQTKLLALNATIEAAHAGEQGKGFAVVAKEVKELAKETADSVSSIQTKIQAIQGDTRSVIGFIKEISAIIESLEDISQTISTSVKEQAVVSREISIHANDTVKDSIDITDKMENVEQYNKIAASIIESLQSSHAEMVSFANSLRESLIV